MDYLPTGRPDKLCTELQPVSDVFVDDFYLWTFLFDSQVNHTNAWEGRGGGGSAISMATAVAKAFLAGIRAHAASAALLAALPVRIVATYPYESKCNSIYRDTAQQIPREDCHILEVYRQKNPNSPTPAAVAVTKVDVGLGELFARLPKLLEDLRNDGTTDLYALDCTQNFYGTLDRQVLVRPPAG